MNRIDLAQTQAIVAVPGRNCNGCIFKYEKGNKVCHAFNCAVVERSDNMNIIFKIVDLSKTQNLSEKRGSLNSVDAIKRMLDGAVLESEDGAYRYFYSLKKNKFLVSHWNYGVIDTLIQFENLYETCLACGSIIPKRMDGEKKDG